MVNDYLEKQKENFNKDGVWDSPQKLAKDRNLISASWRKEHEGNPEYWDILLKDLKKKEIWKGKKVLDYGSGFGGNLEHLLKLVEWGEVVGYDISSEFVKFSIEYLKQLGFPSEKFSVYETKGDCLDQTTDGYFDFIMSYTVLQHIALYSVRYKILEEFYRTLKLEGILSFQMNTTDGVSYYTTEWNGQGRPNCKVSDPKQVVKDLEKIGFKNISY